MIVAAGLPVPVAGTDQFHEFHAHPEFRYLGSVAVPGAVIAFHPNEGWTLFAPVASQEERVWNGDGQHLDELAATSASTRCAPPRRSRIGCESHPVGTARSAR